MIPKKLMKGDHIRVIAPADSISPDLDEDIIRRGVDRLGTMGFEVSFGKHVREVDVFKSTSIENRLQDLHQLLKHIDYNQSGKTQNSYADCRTSQRWSMLCISKPA